MRVLVHANTQGTSGKSRKIATHATSYVLPTMRKRAKTLRSRNRNISTVKNRVNSFPSGDLKLDDDVPSLYIPLPIFKLPYSVYRR